MENSQNIAHKTPCMIVSGFLGSGKTTIILNLFAQFKKNGLNMVYIKNEVGDTDIDTKIASQAGIKSTELLGGCICCTLVGPFAESANMVIEKYKPDYSVIEASGTADPSAIALMISSHPLLYRDSVISVVDVINFEGYKDLSITTKEQTRFTDLIIFNKVEGVPIERKKAVVGYVRELNEHSPIIEAPNGNLDLNLVTGLSSANLDLLLKEKNRHEYGHDKDKNLQDHQHQDNINAVTIKNNKVYRQNEFVDKIASLPKNVIRAKGIVKFTDNQFYIFNAVAGKTNLQVYEAKEMPKENLMVFIGIGVEDGFSFF